MPELKKFVLLLFVGTWMEIASDDQKAVTKEWLPSQRYMSIVHISTNGPYALPGGEYSMPKKEHLKFINIYKWVFQYIVTVGLSANLLSNIQTLINQNLYISQTYLNFSQRLSTFINVYCCKGYYSGSPMDKSNIV